MKHIETCATGLIRPKTTALFFDKLWIPELWNPVFRSKIADLNVPYEIRLPNPKHARGYEDAWFANEVDEAVLIKIKEQYPFLIMGVEFDKILRRFHEDSLGEDSIFTYIENAHNQKHQFRDDRQLQFDLIKDVIDRAPTYNRNKVINMLVKEYAKEGIDLVPIYLDPKQFEDQSRQQNKWNNPTNKGYCLEICLDFIPDVIEEKLTWDQVIEFRNDKSAKEKLIRMRRWFGVEMLQKSEEEVRDILGKKLDDYTWALKKHGIEILVGGCTSILTAVSGPQILNLVSGSQLATIAGGIAIAAGALAWVSSKVIEKTEINRNEIAYIFEVNKLAK